MVLSPDITKIACYEQGVTCIFDAHLLMVNYSAPVQVLGHLGNAPTQFSGSNAVLFCMYTGIVNLCFRGHKGATTCGL